MQEEYTILLLLPDSKAHGANIGPTWVLSAPDGPHVDLIKLFVWAAMWYIEFIFLGLWVAWAVEQNMKHTMEMKLTDND